MYRIGYNTNGLAHHRPIDALRVASDLGYEALALTQIPAASILTTCSATRSKASG